MSVDPIPDLRIRGDILQQARNAGQNGITQIYLRNVFHHAHDEYASQERVIAENLDWLVQRQYLRTTRVRDELSGVERWIFTITDHGLDLIQGSIDPDPGVVIVA